MVTSKEDIVFLIAEVRYKKGKNYIAETLELKRVKRDS